MSALFSLWVAAALGCADEGSGAIDGATSERPAAVDGGGVDLGPTPDGPTADASAPADQPAPPDDAAAPTDGSSEDAATEDSAAGADVAGDVAGSDTAGDATTISDAGMTGDAAPPGDAASPRDAGFPEAAVRANRAPTLYSTPPTTAPIGTLLQYATLAEDLDGDLLTFTLVAGPMGATIHPATGLLLWTPPAGSAGAADFSVRVADPSGAAAMQSFRVALTPGDAPPEITSAPVRSATRGARYTYRATAVDPDDVTLTWAVTGPTGMSVSASGEVTWDVPTSAAGAYPVQLAVRDPAGHEAAQTFSVGVPVPGDTTRPVVSITGPAVGAELRAPVDITGSVSDGALVGYRVEVCPDWGGDCTLVGEGSGSVSGGRLATLDPRTLAAGGWTVRVTAVDASGNTTTATVQVRIQPLEPLGVLVLRFEDLVVRANGVEVTLTRVYDGRDLRAGELGYGWRYEWSSGHVEGATSLAPGWRVQSIFGIPPRFLVQATRAHVVTLALADGRRFRFDAGMDIAPGIPGSIVGVRPTFVDLDARGARLRPLRRGLAPYGTGSDYPLFCIGGEIWEDPALEQPFAPAYFELTTPYGEVFVFDATTGAIQRMTDPSGVTLDLTSGASVRANGADIVRFERDAAGRITSATEVATGRGLRYTRDAAGDLTSATLVTGETQRFTYAAGHRLARIETPGDGPRRYEYDARGRIVRAVSAGGAVTTTVYDDARRTVRVTDALGRTVQTETDAEGRVVRALDGLGHETRFTYVPGTALEATRTDALGRTTSFTYDARGRRTRVRNPAGEETSLTYDDHTGDPITATDGAGRTFRETVDVDGQVTSYVLPDGAVARRFTPTTARSFRITDGLGRESSLTLDERSRVVSQTDTAGRTTTTRYDDVAHTVVVTEPGGGTLRATLDALDRATRVELGAAGTLQYAYTGGSPLPTRVDRPDLGAQELRRDGEGRLAEVVVGGARITEVRYDAVGQVASVRSPEGMRSFRYDAAGRLSRMTTADGWVDVEHDAAGQVTRMTTSAGGVVNVAYDLAGRATAYDEGGGRRVELTYDRSGRPTQVSTGLGLRAAIAYDANGRRSGVTLPGGLAWRWTYHPSDARDDEEAPIASESRPDGITFRYTYDDEGNLATVTDPRDQATAFTRDGDGRVTAVRDVRGNTTRMTWVGATLAEVTGPSGESSRWSHDGAGRTTDWTRPDGSRVTYAYGAGSVRATLPSGAVVEAADDLAAGMRTARGPGGAVREWLGVDHRVRRVEQDDGSAVELAYTANGRLATVDASTPSGAHAVTRYTYDAQGELASATDPAGGVTRFT